MSIRKTHFHQVRNHEAFGVGTTVGKMVSNGLAVRVSTAVSNGGHHMKHRGWNQAKQMVGI